MTGHLCNLPLPPYLRKYLYYAFGSVYGVNFDEIKADDLNDFRTFNEFFTREIDLSKRSIEDSLNQKTLSSPCDGTILSFGPVDSMKCTIDCIKGHDYRLDEFLFGFHSKQEGEDSDKRVSMVERIVDSASTRGNKLMYLVIYLAP